VESEPAHVAGGTPTTGGEIPDFARDHATIAEYEAAKARYQRSAISQAESVVRASYTRKRAAALAEIAAASAALEERRKIAEEAVLAYREAFPRRVRGSQIERPGFFEAIFSFGRAGRLYNEASRAAQAVVAALETYRRRQRADEDLEGWLRRSLHRISLEIKAQAETQEWLDKFHATPEVAELWRRVQAIRAERDAYARRLAAGGVSPLEQRTRFFGENKIVPLRVPFEGVMIDRIVTFGNLSCWIFLDLKGAKFWLPYDRRIDNLIDAVFDGYRVVDELKSKFSSADGRRLGPVDHFMRRFGDEAEARDAWRKRTAALRTQKETAHDTSHDDPEDKRVLDALARLALTVGTEP
jgi:peptidyl-tRNA hydrolase